MIRNYVIFGILVCLAFGLAGFRGWEFGDLLDSDSWDPAGHKARQTHGRSWFHK